MYQSCNSTVSAFPCPCALHTVRSGRCRLWNWCRSSRADTGCSLPGLLSLLYLPTGFFSLACGSCPSLSTELLLLLQPLSVLTFHLDLLFEHHHHLPLGLQQAPAPSGAPPALQQTVQAVLHWGGRLAQSLRGTSGEATTDSSAPSTRPPPGSWWNQLTQASRVYASGGTEGFPLLRWGPRRHGTTADGAQEAPPPSEQTTPGRSVWLGRLFGVPGVPSETESGVFKSRYVCICTLSIVPSLTFRFLLSWWLVICDLLDRR